MKSPAPVDPSRRSADGEPASGVRETTGLERECLRQAIHDVRGPLNTSSVLVDLILALLDKDPQLARSKAPMVVRELRTVARMLDHLVGSSDTLATQTTAMDLGVTLGSAVQSFAAPSIKVEMGGSGQGASVRACPQRLPRLLTTALEHGAASLPKGGSIVASTEAGDGVARVVLTVRGDGVVLMEGRPRLSAGGGWFPVLALARGMGGDARLARADGALRVEIDLPHDGIANP